MNGSIPYKNEMKYYMHVWHRGIITAIYPFEMTTQHDLSPEELQILQEYDIKTEIEYYQYDETPDCKLLTTIAVEHDYINLLKYAYNHDYKRCYTNLLNLAIKNESNKCLTYLLEHDDSYGEDLDYAYTCEVYSMLSGYIRGLKHCLIHFKSNDIEQLVNAYENYRGKFMRPFSLNSHSRRHAWW